MRIDEDLPEELQREAREAHAKKLEGLAKLGIAIAEKRDAAIKARKESGIESAWMACEESYLCIDDLNRHEFANARWAKPTSMEGPVTSATPVRNTITSTAFVRLTPRYVDMGVAKVCEVLLPIHDKAFAFEATPVPDLIKQLKDTTPVAVNGQPVMMPAPDAQGGQQPAEPKQMTQADVAKAKMAKAQDCAERAEKRIYDWMVEANYPAEMRKVVHDAGRIGVGVLKGPFPDTRTSYAYSAKDGVGKLTIERKTAPSYRWVDPWNFFPAGDCGENVHDGEHLFERDFLSSRQLQKLKRLKLDDQSVYLSSQIDKVLEEGPEKCNLVDARNPNQPINKHRFAVWYFVGVLKRADMLLTDAIGLEDLPQDLQEISAIVTVVNDTVIRATPTPLDSGRFNYHTMRWSRRAGHWAGVGIGEQVSMAQRTVNQGTRALFNNAGFSAGVQIVIDQRAIVPADKRWEITPNKFWFVTGESTTDDVNKMFAVKEFPNLSAQLMSIIQMGMKMAEEACNIPLVSQGQNDPNGPQTFGQAELQNSNANTLLRGIAYSVDDDVTEPVVQQSYEWLLLDPDVPEDEKGDFQINARGSISMVEKAIQEQTWLQILAASLNPAYEASPAKAFEQVMISKRLDPRKVQLTEEEKQARAQVQPPKSDAVAVAEINAQTKLHTQDMQNKSREAIAAQDTDRDTAYTQSLADRDEIARLRSIDDYHMKRELMILEYANKRDLNLDDAKKDLTKVALELRTQIQLAQGSGKAPQVADPAFEPAGRAPDGEAFQK